MSEYTPTAEAVRFCYGGTSLHRDARHAEFDRWLAEHDAQVAAKALRDAAEDPGLVGLRYGTPKWLNARADRIARTDSTAQAVVADGRD